MPNTSIFFVTLLAVTVLAGASLSQETASKVEQHAELIKFYTTLRVASVKWSAESDFCDWTGITCNATDGSVSALRLNLHDSLYVGEYAASLASVALEKLDTLRVLELRAVRFADALPDSFFSLWRVEVVDLSQSVVYGNSAYEVSPLTRLSDQRWANLRSLSTLIVNECSMKGPIGSWIFTHPTLSTLESRRNLITQFETDGSATANPVLRSLRLSDVSIQPSDTLCRFPMLREIHWMNVNLAPTECLQTLAHIESVYLQRIDSIPPSMPGSYQLERVVDQLANASRTSLRHITLRKELTILQRLPPQILALQNIETLDIHGWELGSLPSEISTLYSLRHLRISSNKLTTLPDVSALTNLETLDFSDNQLLRFPNEIFDTLSNLRRLHAKNSKAFMKMPERIAFASVLEEMDLSENRFHGSLPALSFPRLSLLSLRINALSGHIPLSICDSPLLQTIDLENNQLEGSIPSCFGANQPALSVINFGRNRLEGAIPERIWRLPQLSTLSLYRNELRGVLPANLSAATPLLHTLELSFNALTGALPRILPRAIRSLDLSNNRFSGDIPETYTRLPELLDIHLYSNQLRGGIPAAIFDNTQLRTLNLASNQLSGPLPHISPETEAARLRTQFLVFDVHHNALNGTVPDWLVRVAVQTMDLSDNRFSGAFPQPMGRFPSFITYLDVSRNLIERFAPFESESHQFPALKVLRLSSNRIRSELVAINARLLEELSLDNNSYSGPLPAERRFPSISKLKILNLAANNFSGQFYEPSTHFPELEWFDCSANRIEGSLQRLVEMFPQAKYINVSSNQLSAWHLPFHPEHSDWPLQILDLSHNVIAAPLPLFFPPVIAELHLNDNRLFGSIAKEIAALHPTLALLNLANNMITGEVPDSFVDSQHDHHGAKLRVLSLSGNGGVRLRPGQFETMLSWPAVEELSLSGINVTQLPNQIHELNRLRVLELAGCAIRGPVPTALIGRLRFVQRLDLSDNRLTAMPEPHVWSALAALQYLNMSHNAELASEMPAEIRSLALRVIDFSNTKVTGSMPRLPSLVLNVVRFANCSLRGTVPALASNAIREFDVSYNMLDSLAAEWSDYRCGNESQSAATEEAATVLFNCDMRGNDLQCATVPGWTDACCSATCNNRNIILISSITTVGSVLLLVIILIPSVRAARRLYAEHRNSRSLAHLEKSLLADALENVEQDLMIAWNDIRFISKLGEGAYGVVYKGMYKEVEVAVKSFKVSPTSAVKFRETNGSGFGGGSDDVDDDFKSTLRELVNEVRFLMKLKHPHIVMLMGASIDKGRLAIVLEYMHRGSLHHMLHANSGPRPVWRTRLLIAYQICSGMLFLHLQQPPVLHRDLKSMNILIDRNYTAKITDFGFSKENSASVTMSMVGTINYMAPEIFGYSESEHEGSLSMMSERTQSLAASSKSDSYITYGTASDVYSFGILMWEILTCRIPWDNCSQAHIISSVLSGHRPPIPQLSDIPALVAFEERRPSASASPFTSQTGPRSNQFAPRSSVQKTTTTTAAESAVMSLPLLLEGAETSEELMEDDVGVGEYVELMQRCWEQRPSARPSFRDILAVLKPLADRYSS